MNVSEEFARRVAADRLCRELARAIAENDTAALERLGMRGFGLYAGRLSELMTESVRRGGFSARDFAAIMGEVASPARYAHHLVNESGSAIQQALDERNGLRIKPAEPEFDDGRLCAIVNNAAESESEHAADNLAVQLGTFVKDMGNEFMRQNAEQRDRAGFKVTITRTGGAKCCPWCADRTGTWTLENAPAGVFGCHDNCKCMTEYTNSKGAVSRRVGRSRFVDVPYEPPRVLTREEAAARGGFDKPKRLTDGANGGIMSSGNSLNFMPLSQESVVPMLRKESEQWIRALSPEEVRAIKKYTKNSGDPKDDKFYARLNAMLRGERPRDSTLEYYSKLISAGIKKFKLEHDLVCYRNLDFNPFVGVVVGDIIQPLQFFSTSVTPKGALKSNFQIEIHTPKGANGAYIEKLSKYPKQREFLFDKDCLYKTISLNSNNMVLEVIL